MSRRAEAGRLPFSDRVERVLGIVRKELLQIGRDPRLKAVIFAAPVIQLLVFGYAVSTDVRDTATFLVDQDRSAASRELVEALVAPGTFRVVGASEDPADLVQALDHGDAKLGLVIPPGYAEALAGAAEAGGTGGARPATVQILVDGTDSNTAQTALGYAERIVSDLGVELLAAHSAEATEPPVRLEERAWFNPDLESRNYNVPAVVGSLLLLIALLLTSLAVVREAEIGTLEQLMVSPLTPVELMVGKMVPFGIIGLVDLALVTTVALLWFRVPLRGSLAVLVLGALWPQHLALLGLGAAFLALAVWRFEHR